MRTIDLTSARGAVVGLELMASIRGRDDEIVVLCRTPEQAQLVVNAIKRICDKGTSAVKATVKTKKDMSHA
jgi:NAD dependent epimerase/dehydratase family enzyme